MDAAMLERVVEQMAEIGRNDREPAVVYFGGGEPLLHPDFIEMLEFVQAQRHVEGINILTNGALVPSFVSRIQKYAAKIAVQVSVDGSPEVNDSIRGAGAFQGAVRALEALDHAGIRHWISYTVSRLNWRCYEDVLRVASSTHCSPNNVTPYTGKADEMLSYLEWKEFKYRFLRQARRMGIRRPNSPTSCGFRYRCSANWAGLTINPDGTATGCARYDRSDGSYDRLAELVTGERRSIHETCMHAAWGSMPHFRLMTMME
jgi:MoaA/NifB/PqqE/SkfB family radical SAM enzyme